MDTLHLYVWSAGSGGTIKLVMALVGKFTVAGSYALICLFSAELFPQMLGMVLRCGDYRFVLMTGNSSL